MSQKPQTSLGKLAEKMGITNARHSGRNLAATIDKEVSQKYNSVRRQSVQGEQCFPCFECCTMINGPDSAYYEAWETMRVPPEDSGKQVCPILRKLCRSCGVKHQTPENTR